jgi:iron(III) transport system substrate-binding protein
MKEKPMNTGHKIKLLCAATLILGTLGAGMESAKATDSVNVYSSRHYKSDRIIIKEFEKATGIKVNVVTGKVSSLFARLKREGRNSPADILITVDAGNLGRAQAANLFQPMKSAFIEKVVPAQLREPGGLWTGLSMRARVIMYHKDRVKPSQLSTYEDLADNKWKGKILIRSSNNIYNQSLVGSLIAKHGTSNALSWAKGILANLARKPKGGDRDQIRAVGAGEGDIAIANTYYLGGLSASKKHKDKVLVAKIGVFFPNQKGRGTHVNISGAGITRYAKNKESAVKLIEYFLTRKSQKIFGDLNYEYPIREDVEAHPIIDSWGKFKKDALNVSVLGANNAAAVRLMDKAGWR